MQCVVNQYIAFFVLSIPTNIQLFFARRKKSSLRLDFSPFNLPFWLLSSPVLIRCQFLFFCWINVVLSVDYCSPRKCSRVGVLTSISPTFIQLYTNIYSVYFQLYFNYIPTIIQLIYFIPTFIQLISGHKKTPGDPGAFYIWR